MWTTALPVRTTTGAWEGMVRVYENRSLSQNGLRLRPCVMSRIWP